MSAPAVERDYIEDGSPCYWEGSKIVHVLPGCYCDEPVGQDNTNTRVEPERWPGSFS